MGYTSDMSTDPFQSAWDSARQGGLERLPVAAVPDPVWAHDHGDIAWPAAVTLAEITALQRALGAWVDTPLPTPRELKDAMKGLRKPPSGPAWWRHATAWMHTANLAMWRDTLAHARETAWARHAQSQHLMNALADAGHALHQRTDSVQAWMVSHPDAAYLAEGWMTQAHVQAATLAMLAQRTQARLEQDQTMVATIGKAQALVELVRTTKGAEQDKAWASLARELPPLPGQ